MIRALLSVLAIAAAAACEQLTGTPPAARTCSDSVNVRILLDSIQPGDTLKIHVARCP